MPGNDYVGLHDTSFHIYGMTQEIGLHNPSNRWNRFNPQEVSILDPKRKRLTSHPSGTIEPPSETMNLPVSLKPRLLAEPNFPLEYARREFLTISAPE